MTVESTFHIQVLKSVTLALSRSDQLDDMANHLVQLLATNMGIKACAIYALDPGTGELERLASFGLTMAYVAKGPVLAEKSIAECMSGTPVIVSDASRDDRIQYPEEAQKEGIFAIVSLPITVSGSVLGTLRLYQDRVWEVPDNDLAFLVLLADLIGLAMNYTTVREALCEIDDVLHRRVPVHVFRDKCS